MLLLFLTLHSARNTIIALTQGLRPLGILHFSLSLFSASAHTIVIILVIRLFVYNLETHTYADVLFSYHLTGVTYWIDHETPD